VNIRPANTADIAVILNLERQSATAAHWTEQRYWQIFQAPEWHHSQRLILVAEETPAGRAEENPTLLGFLIAHHLPPEWELENVVVAPPVRRKGLASRLLAQFLAHARDAEGESVFLEVRESNQAARALYQRHGFEETGSRKAYYRSPVEDAILYRLSLP
jgi:ribosomal-protein-alanine N-acetyltransferase